MRLISLASSTSWPRLRTCTSSSPRIAARFGLTVEPDAGNLPTSKAWAVYDVIPTSLNYLSRYTNPIVQLPS